MISVQQPMMVVYTEVRHMITMNWVICDISAHGKGDMFNSYFLVEVGTA